MRGKSGEEILDKNRHTSKEQNQQRIELLQTGSKCKKAYNLSVMFTLSSASASACSLLVGSGNKSLGLVNIVSGAASEM